MGILEGKVAVITGGGQGIGEGLVYAFCHEGAKVVNIGRTALSTRPRPMAVMLLPCSAILAIPHR